MKSREQDFWNNKLKSMGLDSDIKTEAEKAKEAGHEVVSADSIDPEFDAMAKKLSEEDPRNVFGGFPVSSEILTSLVDTLIVEWRDLGIPLNEIHVAIHSSYVNDNDCIIVVQNRGKRYHYNTERMMDYDKTKVILQLIRKKVPFREI